MKAIELIAELAEYIEVFGADAQVKINVHRVDDLKWLGRCPDTKTLDVEGVDCDKRYGRIVLDVDLMQGEDVYHS